MTRGEDNFEKENKKWNLKLTWWLTQDPGRGRGFMFRLNKSVSTRVGTEKS